MATPRTGSKDLLSRLKANDFTAVVIGLGYVGLPLAMEYAAPAST
jgi:UDP-N-acetyl-D-mannosaminuronate dehydrogenase